MKKNRIWASLFSLVLALSLIMTAVPVQAAKKPTLSKSKAIPVRYP